MGEKQIIYSEHSTTTHSKNEVVDVMIPYYAEHFGNPSSVYSVAEAHEGHPVKMHYSVLAGEDIHKAIKDYRKKQGLEPWVEKNSHSHEHSEDLTCNQQAESYALMHKLR